MELKFLTPTEVWDGYDPASTPLQTSIISAETDDFEVCAKQYFTVENDGASPFRAYAETFYDSRWVDARAALLILGSFFKKDALPFIHRLVQEGFVVCRLDYAGGLIDDVDRTDFPERLSFASYPECNAHMNSIDGSAWNSPWYVWSKIARRGIRLLIEHPMVDKNHIGVIGIGEGAHVAWQVAGVDPFVTALISIDGGGYRWAAGSPRFFSGNLPSNEEESVFSTGVGAETYAKLVRCPVFMLSSRTGIVSDVDRAGDLIASAKSESKHLLITNTVDVQITKASLDVLLKWLRKVFVLGEQISVTPTAAFENVEGSLYLRLNAIQKAESVKAYVCYGEPDSKARHWDVYETFQRIDDNAYTLQLPVFDVGELIVAYATFDYGDNNLVSTSVQGVLPIKIGVQKPTNVHESSKIIYDGSMGLGSFACLSNDPIVDEDFLKTAIGPYNITGITVEAGGLSLSRSNAELNEINRFSTLHFDAYSPTSRDLCVIMLTSDNKKYTAYAELNGGEYWQKILMSCADFKSEEGKNLTNFADTKTLILLDASGVIFNNFLWI